MLHPPAPETGHMLIVDCPFCDSPALLEEGGGALTCEPCALALPIDEPCLVELAAAA